MHSEETKAKIREALRRNWAEHPRKPSPETIAKRAAALRGKTRPAEIGAKIREAALRRWAEGKYEHLRKPKSSAEERAARAALRIERIRAAALRQWAEGRGNSAGILSPGTRRKTGETLKVSPRAREQRAYVIKLRQVRARARRISVASIFDEGKVAELIVRWQRTGDEELLVSIIRGTLRLIDSIICKYSPTSSSEFAEVRNEVILKLATLLPKYDPARGRAFSFFIFSIKYFLISRFHKTVLLRSREVLTDFSQWEETGAVAPPELPLESEEFEARLRELLRPRGWQWRWHWQTKGRLPLPEWQPEWKWQRQGKIAA
jgi:hypothetical protein